MENQSVENSEISLKELIQIVNEWKGYLLSKWRILVLMGLIGGVLGFVYSYFKKPIYTATLTFALEDEKTGGGLGGALGLASTFGIDIGGGGGGSMFTGLNLTELFKSRRMVEKTLLVPVNVNGKVISLAEMYIQDKKWREKWEDSPKLKNIQFVNQDESKFTRVHDSILGMIYQNLYKNSLSVVQKDKKISIISMDVSSNDELFSLYFCEALARQVGEFYVETKSKKARKNMEILERQVDSVRAELNSAITGVAIANDNAFNLNPALNIRRAPSARRQVDVQANTAILSELVKQSELAKVTLRKETPLIQVIDRPILPLPKEKTSKVKGIVFGGFLFTVLTILFLILKRKFNEANSEN
ncbi:Wzz/FepE/Etk N-terminal domain-containing protein [Flavobacterium sp. TR2]|uniref:Wzz/FepE/Etk N-terminal domain-containing protein n=1 Tax=Flavobacterium sp. TR2 TaxID=2977321 RepID=UPI0021B0EF82|nr:Wzz/FepE/Etk N-terminal domain-containing protein [Flavobacterium sp. TR2]UWY28638.1 Wzz/FepE/Etk N-terminal domain-containing protein [Flavobacterium sp. TR2]